MSDKLQTKKAALNVNGLQLYILLAISFGVYINTLWNGFVYDDSIQILQNHWIRDITYLPEIFEKGVWGFRGSSMTGSNYYRPMMHLIYMLDYLLFGFAPWGFHLVNVLLHMAVCVLVFFVTKRLLREYGYSDRQDQLFMPFAVAVIFAVHPIHTEVVAWVAGVPELSFTFFYLLSFYLYMGSRCEQGSKNKRAVLFSLASFFIAMLCKEPAVTLPAALFCYDYVVKKSKDRPAGYIKRYLPYFMTIIAYLALRFSALRGFAPETHWKLSAYQIVVNTFQLFGQYLRKLVLPLNMNAMYQFRPATSIFDVDVLFGFILTAIFVLTFVTLLKKRSILSFGLILVVLPLIPAMYIPAMGRNVFAERYLYLPVFGFSLLLCLLAVWTSERQPRSSRIIALCFLCLVVVYSGMTIARNRIWKDNLTLWSDAVRKSPDEAMVHGSLGQAYFNKGWVDRAIDEYQLALKIWPDDELAHYNLGLAYFEKGWVDRAIDEYQLALKISPDYEGVHNNLGNAYYAKGLVDRAMVEYQLALKIWPDDELAHNNLGNVYYAKGWMDKAIHEYSLTLKISPDDADAHKNLGNAYYTKGLVDRAIDEYQLALKIRPDDADAHCNLGISFAAKGIPDKAIEEFRSAIRLKPGFANAHFNLGHALMNKGFKEEALKELDTAARTQAKAVGQR